MARSVTIRPPSLEDEAGFLMLARASRALHHPWLTAPQTPEQFRAWLTRMQPPQNHAFLVCEARTGQILGVINLSNVVLGLFCSGYLGYYAFAGFEGQGHMRSGLKLVLRHAFKVLKLHRLEANIQPDNLASKALIQSCGFSCEGYSPRYLKIGGRWRDHERWALIAPGR